MHKKDLKGEERKNVMDRKVGWTFFAIGLIFIIVPITIAASFEDVPYSLYAIPWASIGFLIVGWRMAHKKGDS